MEEHWKFLAHREKTFHHPAESPQNVYHLGCLKHPHSDQNSSPEMVPPEILRPILCGPQPSMLMVNHATHRSKQASECCLRWRLRGLKAARLRLWSLVLLLQATQPNHGFRFWVPKPQTRALLKLLPQTDAVGAYSNEQRPFTLLMVVLKLKKFYADRCKALGPHSSWIDSMT